MQQQECTDAVIKTAVDTGINKYQDLNFDLDAIKQILSLYLRTKVPFVTANPDVLADILNPLSSADISLIGLSLPTNGRGLIVCSRTTKRSIASFMFVGHKLMVQVAETDTMCKARVAGYQQEAEDMARSWGAEDSEIVAVRRH